MKSMLFASLTIAGAVGAAVGPDSAGWARTLDARPEAIITGATLLLLASILRRSLSRRRAE